MTAPGTFDKAAVEARGAIILIATLLGGCCHAAAQEIRTTPRSACAGQEVTVQWKLRGEGHLKAVPKPGGWADGAVDSSGERVVTINGPTDFSLHVPEADPAEQYLSAHVAYLSAPEARERGVRATCGADGKVRSTLKLTDVAEEVRVARIGMPTIVRAGHAEDARICVTRLDRRACLSPNEFIAFPVLAQGDWQLELDQPPDPTCASAPSQLRFQVDFDCQ
jgi:hypothetical protein